MLNLLTAKAFDIEQTTILVRHVPLWRRAAPSGGTLQGPLRKVDPTAVGAYWLVERIGFG